MTPSDLVFWGGLLAVAMLGVAVTIALLRLAAGPTLLDRAITLELLAVLLMAVFVVLAGTSGYGILLDVAAVAALVGFISTVGFARYVDTRTSMRGGSRSESGK